MFLCSSFVISETNGDSNGVEEVMEVVPVVEEVNGAVNGGGMVVAAASDAEDESEEEVEQPKKKGQFEFNQNVLDGRCSM